jgi:ATP-dependent RNA helicase DDX35
VLPRLFLHTLVFLVSPADLLLLRSFFLSPFQHREQILHMLEKYQTLIVVGETGSGKTTQIPQYLFEANWASEGRQVVCLQPRRVAATTVAQRVANERGCRLGGEVGYSIRFDNCSGPLTRIKFMTEGVLINEMMRDPLLTKYSVIMLDEAHERTLYLDIVVGLLYKIQKKRKDLRLIISSATLDADSFKKFFNTKNSSTHQSKEEIRATAGAAVMQIEGRTYPVEIFYSAKPVADYVATAVQTILDIHNDQPAGDILAFLTGQDEVDLVCEQLRERSAHLQHEKGLMELLPIPLYGGLPSQDQMKAFDVAPNGMRKAIIATNIAEASVTIDGVVFVVDCGFVKAKGYSPATGIESLVVAPVSRASANQRAGRAGRMQSGKAYRLYTEEAYTNDLPATNIPEMQRSNLAGVILQMKALGIDNVLRFPFLSPPPAQSMVRGLELLHALGALDNDSKLTEPLGIQMSEFPLDPMMAKMLLSSGKFQCSHEIVTIAAMLQVQHVFVSPPNKRGAANRAKLHFSCHEGDHMTLLNVYLAFVQKAKSAQWCAQNFLNYRSLSRAHEIRSQLLQYLRRFGIPLVSCDGDEDAILRCITAGYFANAARLGLDGNYRTLRDNQLLQVHPSSVLYVEKHPSYVVFNDVLLTSAKYMRDITAVEPAWLSELAPHFYEFKAAINRPDPDVDAVHVNKKFRA